MFAQNLILPESHAITHTALPFCITCLQGMLAIAIGNSAFGTHHTPSPTTNHEPRTTHATHHVLLLFLQPQWLWLYVLLFRIAQSFMVTTSFNPDEYWQSLEVCSPWYPSATTVFALDVPCGAVCHCLGTQ